MNNTAMWLELQSIASSDSSLKGSTEFLHEWSKFIVEINMELVMVSF